MPSIGLSSLRGVKLGAPFTSTPPPTPPLSYSGAKSSQTGTPLSEETDDNKEETTLTDDVYQVHRALGLFLDSNIHHANKILSSKSSMYHSLGTSFILYLKSMMTFQGEDVQATMDSLKQTIHIANGLRKKDTTWLDNLTTWVKGSAVDHIKSMSRLQRHAELVYAEAHLLKALLSIVHDESVLSFVREGLNIRNSYNTYCNLEKYIQLEQDQFQDKDFHSGVALGIGCFNIILSMLPSTVIKVAEVMGFSADRNHGLCILESVGGWQSDATPHSGDGLRRPLCDMVLMLYHILISKMLPLSDVNEPLAERILTHNLRMYPTGVFVLYFKGKSLISKGELDEAQAQYERAIETQKDWKQLQHMCYWELGIIHIMRQEWEKCTHLYETLYKESNWSKAVYLYLKALSMDMCHSGSKEEVLALMEKVSGEKQKIAGKSVPMEKFVSRKSRKYVAQSGRLLLPDLEMLHAFSAFDYMPVPMLRETMRRINEARDGLDKDNDSYWDDICLVQYLGAVTARMLFEKGEERDAMRALHEKALATVLDHAAKIRLDHYLYYFAQYEKACMLILDGKYDKAETHIQVVLRASERGQYVVGKTKYSLANALVFKCHNCLTHIQSLEK